MKLGEALELLEGHPVSADFDPDIEIQAAGAADLMSDVLAFAQGVTVLLTGLLTPLVVRTAEVLGIRVLIFVRGKVPPPDIVSLAAEEGVLLAATDLTLFEACGRLYSAGVQSSGVRGEARRRIDEKLAAFREKAVHDASAVEISPGE